MCEEELVRVQIDIRKCDCGAIKEPHYHVDQCTVIPWDAFMKSLEDLHDASIGEVREGVRVVKCSGLKVC